MSDAYTQFGLLLAAIWASHGEAPMVVRSADHSQGPSGLQLGADSSGRRHILAPIAPDYVYTPERLQFVELTEWKHPLTGRRYLDLRCDSDQLTRPFGKLADDVIERAAAGAADAHVALLDTFVEWRKLLRPSRQLSEEAARGLFGELVVLRELAKTNPHFAVHSWSGPEGGVHDFSTPKGDLEVKTTKTEGRTVEMSSLRQLDLVAGVPLVLIRVRASNSPAGQNLGELVDELTAMGCLHDALVEKLAEADFMMGIDSDEHRFVVDEPLMHWSVDHSFPGLRSNDIPDDRSAPISRIKYTLDLIGAPNELSGADFERFRQQMMTS